MRIYTDSKVFGLKAIAYIKEEKIIVLKLNKNRK